MECHGESELKFYTVVWMEGSWYSDILSRDCKEGKE